VPYRSELATPTTLSRAARHGPRAGGASSTALGGFGSLVVILFVGLFAAFEPALYRRGLLRLLPPGRRARAGEILSLMAHTLRMWMLGKMASMALVGIATWVGLALLGIPLAVVLSLLAAVLAFIPNLGPILSVIPAILLALLQGSTTALWVAGLYVGIQAVESYILTPLLQKNLVSLPPAVTLIAQVIMGTLAGGLGVIVATPLTAAALVLIKEAYVRDLLGDDDPPDR
jgi:predicted PurR-regulated permease PerM